MSFSHSTVHGSTPLRVQNMVNGMRLPGLHVDRSPVYPNVDVRFAVPAGRFPPQAPPLSHRSTGPTQTLQLSNEYNGHEQVFVHRSTSYPPVPTDTSAFYRNPPNHQGWFAAQPSQSTSLPLHATAQTQSVAPEMAPFGKRPFLRPHQSPPSQFGP